MRFSTFISLLLLSNFCNLILAGRHNQRQNCDPVKCYKSLSCLQGTFVPVFTTFGNNGNLDISSVEEYVKYLASNGITGCVINDAAAGGAVLTLEETKKNFKAWLKYGKKYNMTMIADVGEDLTYKDIKSLAAFASKIGFDAVLSTSFEFYSQNCTERLLEFVAGIARAAYPVPTMYYYTQEAGDDLNMVKFAAMAIKSIPNFGGFKADYPTLMEVQAVTTIDEKMTFLSSSNFNEVGPYLFCINGTSTLQANIFPAKTVQIKQSVARGHIRTALELQNEINHAIGSCLSVLNVDRVNRDVYPYVSRLLREVFILTTGIDVGVPPNPPLPSIPRELVLQCAAKLRSQGVQFASN